MKHYPKIDYYNKGLFDEYCYAFDKIDGSNLRFEYNQKRGFYKFGSRNVMIDKNDPILGGSIELFLDKYSDELEKQFKTKSYRNIDNFVVFGEFYGENSFAGQHVPSDDKDIIIFDISQYKKGFITPRQFIDDFGHLGIPKVIYTGLYNMDLINSIKNNVYNLKEGVVTKGTFKSDGNDQVWQVKIKTNEWLQKVKSLYGDKALLSELNGDISLLRQ